MSGFQEVSIQIRSNHLKTLREIATKEYGNGNEIEKVIFSALLDYFEARSTNQILEEAVREGLQLLEEHLGVLLDLVKTLLISSSYDTTKTRLLLEFLFENDMGKDLIPELYKRTSESVIERLKEEELENTAQIIAEMEELKRQIYDLENKEELSEKQKQQDLERQQSRDKEYAETVRRLTEKANFSEQQQKRITAWTNGLISYLSQNQGDIHTLLQSYISKNPKPEGIL